SIVRKNVFDSAQSDWFFAAPLANAIHIVTQRYIIDDELLFEEEDNLDYNLVQETERNLRNTGLFTKVKIDIDTVNEYLYNIIVTTQDRWSTAPAVLLGTGGNNETYGGRIQEYNLVGTGTDFSIEGLYRTENDIGWQGRLELYQRRLFRTELSLHGRLLTHKYRTEQELSVYKPFRTLSTIFSYGFEGRNFWGNDFLYPVPGTKEFMPFHEKSINFWFSRAWRSTDRVFATALIELNDINRGKPEFRRAYDNSGKILIAFSSVAEDYIKTSKLNYYLDEDLPIGGWGTAVLGKTFAIGHSGEGLYYVGAQGERSYYDGKFYLFGQLTGASAFNRYDGLYTYQEFLGLGFIRLGEDFVFATRVRQQTVWNWHSLRQLIMDNESGLRGYQLNSFAGDNRLVANFEFRMFPEIEFWIFKLGGLAFYDIGTVWRQQVNLDKTQWHSSAGFGFRIQNMKTTGPTSLFRIDFAFNFDERKFGGIVFTTDQLFSIFRKHEFRLPTMFGTDFDYE
ncbi:MAG: hypothetical protein WCT77_13825, partial [Bacteroidota bacterium]